MENTNLKEKGIHNTDGGQAFQTLKRVAGYVLCCAVCIILTLQPQLCRAAAEETAAGPAEKTEGVTFLELNQKEVFLKQSQAKVCTLTSSAMMIRRAAMLSGNMDWKQITEHSVRKSAWAEGTGLKWNFKAYGISVTQKRLSSPRELVTMLDKHPEGIVIYNSRKPHAILVTDYTDGVFYCSDPSNDKPSGRYPVSQASITVESASRCWYVKLPQGLTVMKENTVYPLDYKVDDLMYQILDHEEKTAVCKGAVTETASVDIPDTVTINGMAYQVAKIAQSAFAYSEKLKEITIGANVTDIEPKAFYQCKKLKKITVHAAKLKEIGTDAFAQIYHKAQILIADEQIEKLAALLTGTSIPETATVRLS